MGAPGHRDVENVVAGIGDVASAETNRAELKARALSIQLPKNCVFQSSMVGGSCARVDMEAEVDVPAVAMFKLLANPQEHERIFESIERASSTLIFEEGAKRRYTLDYQARWKFWRVTGVCENRLIMETDADEGTVTFKLREPGFLRTYEGTWQIIPKGSNGLHLHRNALKAQRHVASTPTRHAPGATQHHPTSLSPMSEIHGRMSSFCSRLLAPSSPSSPSLPSSPSCLAVSQHSFSSGPSLAPSTPGACDPSDFSTLHSFSGTSLASMTAGNSKQFHQHQHHPAHHAATGSCTAQGPSLSRFAGAAQQPAGASPTPWAEQQVVEEEEWSQGEAGSATTSVVRVKGMLMSPKLAPPYPLGGLLKGQVISQIQDMLKGLMAAAQHAATEDASARSTAAKPVTSSNGPARKSLGVQGGPRHHSMDMDHAHGWNGRGSILARGGGNGDSAFTVTSHCISLSDDEGDEE
ncbi:hypothetical protein V8C86DRAFT_1588562 [Haematococcus lacustris]